MAQEETLEFIEHLRALLGFLLPAYVAEGKSYLSIGIGCTGGATAAWCSARSWAT